jgi:sRNA-binding regulator protein Hfq
LLTHQDVSISSSAQLGGQAEILYFQKQMQAQTLMVFVLDDGERIEGVIEWCDLHVIKVRHTTRTMIYKSSIKYLYKASEVRSPGVMPGSGS